jgi:site-specific recombinase XerD
MKNVKLTSIFHNKNHQIAISFGFDNTIKSHLVKLPGIRWSKTHSSFYIQYSLENKKKVYDYLRKIGCFVDYKELKPIKPITKPTPYLRLPKLKEAQEKELQKFKKWLQQKRLSGNTVNTYIDVTGFFIRYKTLKNEQKYSKRVIEAFNYDFIVRPNKSISYQNQCINGIKKYLEYKAIDIESLELKRPKKEKKLPVVLSMEEVKCIISSTHNLKHKTLLSLIYSAGLRIGEAISLKATDIDSKRMLIHIKGAKGKKDRYTLLSSSFLDLLRKYYRQYRPTDFLFEGLNKKQYSTTSAQKVLKRAVDSAGIKKHITLHTLRHSFATHLLENGTDIRYIQELLGHSSPKTTMIYTHVTQTSIRNIKNPFDIL